MQLGNMRGGGGEGAVLLSGCDTWFTYEARICVYGACLEQRTVRSERSWRTYSGFIGDKYFGLHCLEASPM